MSDYILVNDTLYHHGIKGQKWGLRRFQNEDGSLTPEGREHYGYVTRREEAKQNYKNARKAYRLARREASKGFFAGSAARERNKKVYEAEYNKIKAKAEYNAAKKKNAEKAAKAEFNTYRNEMARSGLQGSAADAQSGGRSSRLYDQITRDKGKEYADRVEAKVKSDLITTAVASGVLFIASSGLNMYLSEKYY